MNRRKPPTPGMNRRKPPTPSALDAEIITLLQADGRKSSTAIAKEVGVAEATVRRRINRLLEEQVIQVGAWADPLKIGYQIYIIQIQTNPPEIEKVAKCLAEFQEIFFLGICTGEFDIYAAAVLASAGHLYEFITRRLLRVPGVQRTSTSNMIRIVKRKHAYPVPAVRRRFDVETHGQLGEHSGGLGLAAAD